MAASQEPPARRLEVRASGSDRSYFADFVCREKMLVVEIDGATHSTDEEIASDARRTAFLEGQGFRVIRFINAQIYENVDGALEAISRVLGDGGG
jgi:very-short-patch-repair endonuclease